MSPKIENPGAEASISSLTPLECAWFAGLFQAEAYFHFDKRVRARTPGYTPVPPIPQIKIEMVEDDLMQTVGTRLGCTVTPVNRRTSAGKQVYKVVLSARAEVEAFLLAIQPHIIGVKTGNKIKEMLKVCEEHKAWEAAGGRSAAARVANLASQEAKKRKKLQ